MIHIKLAGKSMREPVVTTRHRLGVIPEAVVLQPIKQSVKVSLPLINRLELAETLGGSLFLGGGREAHSRGILAKHVYQDNQSEYY